MSAPVELLLQAEVRDASGKEWAKKARREGKLPGVLYGPGKQPLSIILDTHKFTQVRKAFLGESLPVPLALSDGSNEKVFIKEVQRDPVTGAFLHVDLYRIDPNHKVHLDIKVRQIGATSAGVKEGGVLETVRSTVRVEGLPAVIPSHIDIDLSALEVGDSIHVSDLPQIEGLTYLDDPHTALFVLVGKTVEEEPAAAAAVTPEAAAAAGAAPAAPAPTA
jgi:large subunit ribosomal protein L25